MVDVLYRQLAASHPHHRERIRAAVREARQSLDQLGALDQIEPLMAVLAVAIAHARLASVDHKAVLELVAETYGLTMLNPEAGAGEACGECPACLAAKAAKDKETVH